MRKKLILILIINAFNLFAYQTTTAASRSHRGQAPKNIHTAITKGFALDARHIPYINTPTAIGDLPLWTARMSNNEEATRFLLKHGASPDALFSSGMCFVTSMYLAIDALKYPEVKKLLWHGTDPAKYLADAKSRRDHRCTIAMREPTEDNLNKNQSANAIVTAIENEITYRHRWSPMRKDWFIAVTVTGIAKYKPSPASTSTSKRSRRNKNVLVE